MVKLLSDGRGTLFAPEGDGCLQRAKRENAGRFSKEGKSLDDFWYFSSQKITIKEKWLYLKKTPHPSAYGCHLLPLEKAGKMS